MSKQLASIPLRDMDRISIYINQCKKPLPQIKAETGADYLLNGGTWTTSTKPDPWLKADGKVLASADWSNWGFAWNTGPDICMTNDAAYGRNFISCVALLTPWDGINERLSYPKEMGGTRGRSAIALAGDKLILYCTGDGTRDAATPEALRMELYKLGAETAIMLDGGGSSQCDFAGQRITSARKVQNLILVWTKKTGTEPEKEGPSLSKKVVLDPGHGVETAGKRSPDGSYLEHEFALDMATRIKPILERHGVAVTVTRSDEHDITLAKRVQIANGIKDLDLFVSLHSNAEGNGKQWMSARGYGIYTSAAGATAGRNIAAGKLIARAKEAEIGLWGDGLHHDISLYVLKNTVAPAVIIEHLFHDNREDTALLKDSAYRDKLAEVDAKGILDYLGIAWADKPTTGGIVCPHCGGKLKIEKG